MQQELNDMTEDQVRNIFNSLDKDGSGFLEQNELLQAIKQLGVDMSQYQFKKIMKKLDTDKDGKVSFEEFYQWWHFGKQQGLEDLVFLKMKAQKYLNKSNKKLTKIGQLDGNPQDTQEHSISLNVGDAPPKSYLGFRGFVGQEATDISKELSENLDDIEQETPAIIIKVQVKDANEAKEQFEEIFEQVMVLAESMLPPEYADKYLETIKINVSVYESDHILIGITGQHELVQEIVNEYTNLLQLYLPPDFVSTLNANLSLGLDLEDFTNNKDKKFDELISEAGMNLTIDGRLNQSLLSKTQNTLLEKFKKWKEQDKEIYGKKEVLQIALPLFFIQGSKVNLNFKTFDKVIQEIGLPIPESGPQTVGDGIELLKGLIGEDPKEMMEEIPILEELLNLFKSQCKSDVTVTVQVPQMAIQLYGVTKGVSTVVDMFLESE